MIKFFLVLFFIGVTGVVQAQESFTFSGLVSEEGGFTQGQGQGLVGYQYSRALLRSRWDIVPELGFVVEGETIEQTPQGSPLHWLTYSQANYADLEAKSRSTDGFDGFARLDRTYLQWVSGRWDLTAGLQSFDVHSSNFYSPTTYFNPMPALALLKDKPLGSEGVKANCFLFDDLSVEGSTRVLANGTTEWVARVIDKGIGVGLTPSFASLVGRNGVGLNLSATFPDFQARFEGTDWSYNGGVNQLEWVAALSTLVDHAKVSLECLQDNTGEALGAPGAFVVFASVKKNVEAEWPIELALLKSSAGNALLFWPKVTWIADPNLHFDLQGQWWIGDTSGNSVPYPGQTGLYAAYFL